MKKKKTYTYTCMTWPWLHSLHSNGEAVFVASPRQWHLEERPALPRGLPGIVQPGPGEVSHPHTTWPHQSIKTIYQLDFYKLKMKHHPFPASVAKSWKGKEPIVGKCESFPLEMICRATGHLPEQASHKLLMEFTKFTKANSTGQVTPAGKISWIYDIYIYINIYIYIFVFLICIYIYTYVDS